MIESIMHDAKEQFNEIVATFVTSFEFDLLHDSEDEDMRIFAGCECCGDIH